MWGALHHGARVVGPRGVARRHALATIGRENTPRKLISVLRKTLLKCIIPFVFFPYRDPRALGAPNGGGAGAYTAPQPPPVGLTPYLKAYIPGRRTALPRWGAGAQRANCGDRIRSVQGRQNQEPLEGILGLTKGDCGAIVFYILSILMGFGQSEYSRRILASLLASQLPSALTPPAPCRDVEAGKASV